MSIFEKLYWTYLVVGAFGLLAFKLGDELREDLVAFFGALFVILSCLAGGVTVIVQVWS